MNPSQPSQPQKWTIEHDEIDEPTGITVRVSRNDADKPRYSLSLGILSSADLSAHADSRTVRLRPFVGLEFERRASSKGMILGVMTRREVVASLWQKCEEWVEDDVAWLAEQSKKKMNEVRLDAQIAREKQQLERQRGPKPPPGLKTLAKQDKARRELKLRSASKESGPRESDKGHDGYTG